MPITLPTDDELIQLARCGVKGKLFQFIADTAASWDGTNPIRSM